MADTTNNSFYQLFLLFLISLSLYGEVAFGYTNSEVSDSKVRCMGKERQALLEFKRGLVDHTHLLSSWGSGEDNKECCKWWGVKCSNTTNRVIVLDLHRDVSDWQDGRYLEGEISNSLTELQHLLYLDLSYNRFSRSLKGEVVGSLHRLQYLSLHYNWFSGIIPHQLGNLTSLQTLNLGWNPGLKASNLEWLSQLRFLRQLDLSSVILNGNNWPQVIFSLPFLEKLHLNECNLGGDDSKPSSLLLSNSSSESLSVLYLFGNGLTSSSTYYWLFNVSKNLVSLDLRRNSLEGPIPDAFGEMISLEDIYLGYNLLEGVIPKSFQNLSHLRLLSLESNYNLSTSLSQFLQKFSRRTEQLLETLKLDSNEFYGYLTDLTRFPSLRALSLKGNKIRGMIPESIGQLSRLETLDLSSNLLEGIVSQVHFSKLSNLKVLDLSFNSLTLNMSSEWVPASQLDVIRLANCNLGRRFPQWLKTQNNFSELDLSLNNISDTLPNWFWDLSPKLNQLNLSYNQISGTLPELSHKFHGDYPVIDLMGGFPVIDLSSNNFSGPILSIPPNWSTLHLYKNKFMGSISFLCTNLTIQSKSSHPITSLDLSDNRFSGDIPDCWMGELAVLNLARNNFSGRIPESLGNLDMLEILHLSNNFLVGELPSSLKNCTWLKVIDAGGNKLSGNIPGWIATHLTSLRILSLRSNKFHGDIRQDICQLSDLQILDLSRNNITGKIPHCLYNFTSLAQENSPTYSDSYLTVAGSIYKDAMMVLWKRQESEYKKSLRYLRIIDLSCNKLVGQIPEEIARLRGLISLNLSSNHLTGKIVEIGQMKMLESLDLSRNQLSGKIPSGLAHLDFLAVLNLSYNDLSGKIPSSNHLQTFDASSYIGNKELCGPPLKQCRWDALDTQPYDCEKKNNVEDEDNQFITKEFYMSMGIGFVFGLWGVFVVLLKVSWRNAYFRWLQNTSDWFYVMSRVYMARLKSMLFG